MLTEGQIKQIRDMTRIGETSNALLEISPLRPQEETKPKGLLLKTLDLLNRGNYAVANFVNSLFVEKEGLGEAFSDAWRGLLGKQRMFFSDVLENAGVRNRALRAIAGFVLDVGLDPLTYLTFGVGGGTKLGLKTLNGAGEALLQKSMKKWLPVYTKKYLAKGVSKKMAKTLARQAIEEDVLKFALKHPEKYLKKAGIRISGPFIKKSIDIPGVTKLSEKAFEKAGKAVGRGMEKLAQTSPVQWFREAFISPEFAQKYLKNASPLQKNLAALYYQHYVQRTKLAEGLAREFFEEVTKRIPRVADREAIMRAIEKNEISKLPKELQKSAKWLDKWLKKNITEPEMKAGILRRFIGAKKPEAEPILKELEKAKSFLKELKNDAKKVYKAAQVNQKILNKIMKDVKPAGAKIKRNVKSVESLVGKVIRKIRAGEKYNILSPKDHSRGAIILKDWKDAPAVIEKLGKLGFSGEETIFSPLNHFGYRGINLNVKFPNGLSGEIQIHTPESWRLKTKISDPLYRKWRNIINPEKELSSKQLKERARDIVKSKRLWRNYWRTIPFEIRSAISESVKSLPKKSSALSPEYTRHLPSLYSKAGLPSQLGLKSTRVPSLRSIKLSRKFPLITSSITKKGEGIKGGIQYVPHYTMEWLKGTRKVNPILGISKSGRVRYFETLDDLKRAGFHPIEDAAVAFSTRYAYSQRLLAFDDYVQKLLDTFGTKIDRKTFNKLIKGKKLPEGVAIYAPRHRVRFWPLYAAKKSPEEQKKILKALNILDEYEGIRNWSSGEALKMLHSTPLGRALKITEDIPAYLLPKEIAERLNAIGPRIPSEMGWLKGALVNLTNWWKASVTSWFPAFHARNAMSNGWLAYLAGMSPTDMARRFKQAAKIQRYGFLKKLGKEPKDFVVKLGEKKFKASEIYEMALENRIFSGWYVGELMMGHEREMLRKTGKLTQKWRGKIREVLLEKPRAVGSAVEDNARLGLFLDRLAKGDAPHQAALQVKKFLFDYQELTPFERQVMRNIIPFYTWLRKNIPFELEQLVQQPGKFARIGKLKYEIESLSERPDERFLPKWMGQEEIFVRIPGKKGGLPLYLNPDFAFQDLARLNFSDPDVLRDWFATLNPVIKIPFESLTNYSLFRGRNLVDPDLPEEIQFREAIKRELLDHLRIWGYERRLSREEVPMVHKILDAVLGLKPYPYDEIKARQWYYQRQKQEQNALKRYYQRKLKKRKEFLPPP